MVKEIFKRRPRFIPGHREEPDEGRVVPKDIWISCPHCHELLYAKEYEDTYKVCPKCSFHAHLTAPERIVMLLDEGSFEEIDGDLHSLDPLQFRSPDRVYADKLAADRLKTGFAEALIYGRGRLDDIPVVLAVHNFPFRAGTMGVVVGEKIARAIELSASTQNTPDYRLRQWWRKDGRGRLQFDADGEDDGSARTSGRDDDPLYLAID